MAVAPFRRIDRHSAAGFTLVEVLVSALLLGVGLAGTVGAFDTGGRSAVDSKRHSEADDIAQEDEDRMRAMGLDDLADQQSTSRTVVLDGTTFTIVSRADFVTDKTGTTNCTAGTASPDYVKTTSTVSWAALGARAPVVEESIVPIRNDSVDPTAGGLAAHIYRADGSTGQPGISVTVSGQGKADAAATNSSGCVLFGGLPAGNYAVSFAASGLVDPFGNTQINDTQAVVARSTNVATYFFDAPGTVKATWDTSNATTPRPAANGDQLMLVNSNLQNGGPGYRSFGTAGTSVASLTATNVFPFSSTYAVYAGSCTGNDPTKFSGGSSYANNVSVVSGSQATPTVHLPQMIVNVQNSAGAAQNGAHVVVTDVTSGCTAVKRTYTTTSTGKLTLPLPFGSYAVCADFGNKMVSTASPVTNATMTGTGTTVPNLKITTTSGTCP